MSITTRKAKTIIKTYLDKHKLAYSKITAKTVDFTDLARDQVIFVKIHGWAPDPKARDLVYLARSNHFCVEFTGRPGPALTGSPADSQTQ